MNNFPTTFTLVDPDLFNDEYEIDHFIHGQTAKNTLLGNKYSLGVFKRFLWNFERGKTDDQKETLALPMKWARDSTAFSCGFVLH